jgi:hypothetical protein
VSESAQGKPKNRIVVAVTHQACSALGESWELFLILHSESVGSKLRENNGKILKKKMFFMTPR